MPRSNPKVANPRFVSTQWSLVIAAGRPSSPATRDALASLCSTYWHPLYAYVRRCGYAVADAQDLTQEFFSRLIEKNYLKTATRERGRFRSFLLASMKHFLANEWDRAAAKKRGGGITHVSLEFDEVERITGQEASRTLTPEELYERCWALTLIGRALARIEGEFTRAGKADLFDCLKNHLIGSGDRTSYAETASRIGMTEGAVKVAAHRMRTRFRDLLRSEIAQTVASPDQVDDEVRYLLAVMS
ncbi:MAG TPA: sigma-70 family RNA polymerase sigma factor [Blastocatellia bacterium]|nr:sigma-70 family RNA polymerase sigma factor [Blastocatellia bacterium]